MYDIPKIKLYSVSKATTHGVTVDSGILDYEVDRAIDYGCTLRNCTSAELLAETKDYTIVLSEMVMSALVLYDKYGRQGYTENGIQNVFEDGNIYQKEQTRVFVPLIRGV
jgi:hypothetical protein